MDRKKIYLIFVIFLLLSAISMGYIIYKYSNYTKPQKNESNNETEGKIKWEDLFDILNKVFAIEVNTTLNFSNKIEIYDEYIKHRHLGEFMEIKWDFEGDGVWDWNSTDNPRWRLDSNGHKEYPTHTYKKCGIYIPQAIMYYYDYKNNTIYRDIKDWSFCVYKGFVKGSENIRAILHINKNHIYLNNSKDEWIDWKINFTNTGNKTLLFRYMHSPFAGVAFPTYEVNVYMITPEGYKIQYKPYIVPSLYSFTHTRASSNEPPILLYPNQSVDIKGYPFCIGNEQKAGGWHYANNNTTYYFKNGTYTLYFAVYAIDYWVLHLHYSSYTIVDELYIPIGSLITQTINVTVEVRR